MYDPYSGLMKDDLHKKVTDMPDFTVVGLKDSGIGFLRHIVANNANDALLHFSNDGFVLVVLDGWHENRVKTNIIGPDGQMNNCSQLGKTQKGI